MLLLDRVVEAVDVGQLRHVGAHAAHSSADRPDRRVKLILATAGDEHGRALGREALGGGKADAAGPAGHDDHLALESSYPRRWASRAALFAAVARWAWS